MPDSAAACRARRVGSPQTTPHPGRPCRTAGRLPETQTGTLAKIVGDRITVADLKARIKGLRPGFERRDLRQDRVRDLPASFQPTSHPVRRSGRGDTARTGRATTRKPSRAGDPQGRPGNHVSLGISRHRTRARPLRGIVRERSPKESASANSPPVRGCRFFAACLSSQPGRKASYKRHCASTWTATARSGRRAPARRPGNGDAGHPERRPAKDPRRPSRRLPQSKSRRGSMAGCGDRPPSPRPSNPIYCGRGCCWRCSARPDNRARCWPRPVLRSVPRRRGPT